VNALKLTSYFGERDRAGGRFLSDALADVYAEHRIRASVVLRGVEGFGVKHHLRTDRQLTLSEDLPLVSVAVDRSERVEGVLGEVVGLFGEGLITLERAVRPRAARLRPAATRRRSSPSTSGATRTSA
jgi:PII-like signaling protein